MAFLNDRANPELAAAAKQAAANRAGAPIVPVKPAAPVAAEKPSEPARFVAGQTYTCRSICSYDTIFEYTIIRRTAKTIWIKHWDGSEKRRGVSVCSYDNAETCYPDGRYSMCPVIRA